MTLLAIHPAPHCQTLAFMRLFAQLVAQGLSVETIATQLGTTATLLEAVATGARPASVMPLDAMRRLAMLLGVAPAQVFLWAGVLGEMDFIAPGDIPGMPGTEAYQAFMAQFCGVLNGE